MELVIKAFAVPQQKPLKLNAVAEVFPKTWSRDSDFHFQQQVRFLRRRVICVLERAPQKPLDGFFPISSDGRGRCESPLNDQVVGQPRSDSIPSAWSVQQNSVGGRKRETGLDSF